MCNTPPLFKGNISVTDCMPLLKTIKIYASVECSWCINNSTIAERPRDASCLSEVNSSNTKRQTQYFIVSYTCYILRTIKCCSVVFGVTFTLLVINISSSSPTINKLRRLLQAMCHALPRSGGAVLITRGSRSVDSTRWSQILAQNRDFCLPPPAFDAPLVGFPSEYCHAISEKKLEWCGYPMVNFFKRYIYSFPQNVRTWQTDTQMNTTWQHRARLHSIAWQQSRFSTNIWLWHRSLL